MAYTVPVVVSYTVEDEWGIKASSAAYALADPTKTITQLEAEVSAYIAAVDGVTDGVITENRVSIQPALPGGIKTAAKSGSRVEQTGLLGFRASGTSKRYSLDVPALSNTSTVLSGDRIQLSAGVVTTLLAILTTAATVFAWCNEHSQQISSFLDALIAFHKKRKQLQRSSFET